MLRRRSTLFICTCLFVLLGVNSSLWATSLSSANKSNPALLNSLRIRYVHTGQVGYVSLHLERPIRPLLAGTTQLIFGSGRQENKEASDILPDSNAFVIAVGGGIRRYIKETAPRGIWLEASLAIAYISVSFEESRSYPLPRTQFSGVVSGNIGYSWILTQGWAVELLGGITWPSLYPRMGVVHGLEPDFFAGLSLASTF